MKDLGRRLWTNPLKTLTSPEAIELAVTAYVTGRVVPAGPTTRVPVGLASIGSMEADVKALERIVTRINSTDRITSLAAQAELRVSEAYRMHGSKVQIRNPVPGQTFDLTVDGIATEVKRISNLTQQAVSDVAKAVKQLGPEGGRVVIVRAADSRHSIEDYIRSFVENFKPKNDKVSITVVDETTLPPLLQTSKP